MIQKNEIQDVFEMSKNWVNSNTSRNEIYIALFRFITIKKNITPDLTFPQKTQVYVACCEISIFFTILRSEEP